MVQTHSVIAMAVAMEHDRIDEDGPSDRLLPVHDPAMNDC
jgi:hypothetical protein